MTLPWSQRPNFVPSDEQTTAPSGEQASLSEPGFAGAGEVGEPDGVGLRGATGDAAGDWLVGCGAGAAAGAVPVPAAGPGGKMPSVFVGIGAVTVTSVRRVDSAGLGLGEQADLVPDGAAGGAGGGLTGAGLAADGGVAAGW